MVSAVFPEKAGFLSEAANFNLQGDVPSERCASVLGIGTAVPPTVHLQSDYPEYFFNITNSNDKADLKEKFTRICERSGVKKRNFYMTEERLLANPSIPTYLEPSLNIRQKIAIAQVPKLAQEAAEKAIKEWGRPKSEITHVVFTTSSGVNLPGADFAVSKLLGLRPNVNRVMMYHIGCYGGAAAMRVGKDLAENNKGARVLVMASEITCVSFRAPTEAQIDGLVGSALFGDGAAAIILGSDPCPGVERPIFEIKWAGGTIIPECDSAIEGHLTEAGLIIHLSKEVPGLIAKNIEKFLFEAKKSIGSPEWNKMFWAVHPGGPQILDQVEAKLGLEKTKLGASRDTLSEYGNIWSVAVFFVLDRIRQRSIENGSKNSGEGNDYGLLVAFGPGLTIEALSLKSLPLAAEANGSCKAH